MRIFDRLHNEDVCFEIDPGSISLHSIDKRFVVLPYNGFIPESMNGVTNPRIYFNVQPFQKARVVFIVDDTGCKSERFSIDITNLEIDSVLQTFFFNNKDHGMAPYNYGIWTAHFQSWHDIVTNPAKICLAVRDFDKSLKKDLLFSIKSSI